MVFFLFWFHYVEAPILPAEKILNEIKREIKLYSYPDQFDFLTGPALHVDLMKSKVMHHVIMRIDRHDDHSHNHYIELHINILLNSFTNSIINCKVIRVDNGKSIKKV